MKPTRLATVAALLLAPLSSSLGAQVQPAASVSLARLQCGTNAAPTDVGARFSDTYAYSGLKVQLTTSCYVVRHGDDYFVWDAGYAPGLPTSPKVTLVDLLQQLSVTPAQVKFVGVSHYHGDHTGQLPQLTQSTLLIGKGDWDVLNDPKMSAVANPTSFARWISGGGKVEPLVGDRDVFGDGTVIMLNTPGHTPGHHSLLVRLKDMGNVLITGDVTHFRENFEGNGVPTFNTDRAASLASLDRFNRIAANLHATVIIQHDERDVSKLPPFPGWAK
ncbi:MAG: N-acyl homoserine lactonase family protein [bacterium]